MSKREYPQAMTDAEILAFVAEHPSADAFERELGRRCCLRQIEAGTMEIWTTKIPVARIFGKEFAIGFWSEASRHRKVVFA